MSFRPPWSIGTVVSRFASKKWLVGRKSVLTKKKFLKHPTYKRWNHYIVVPPLCNISLMDLWLIVHGEWDNSTAECKWGGIEALTTKFFISFLMQQRPSKSNEWRGLTNTCQSTINLTCNQIRLSRTKQIKWSLVSFDTFDGYFWGCIEKNKAT